MERVTSSAQESALTIVKQDDVFPDYTFERLRPELLDQIRDGYESLPRSFSGVDNVQPRHLECVLQVAGLHIPEAGFASAEFWRGCIAYVGAVNSRKFIAATDAWRHRQTTCFAHLLGHLKAKGADSKLKCNTLGFNE